MSWLHAKNNGTNDPCSFSQIGDGMTYPTRCGNDSFD
jgi:hypothetical protein